MSKCEPVFGSFLCHHRRWLLDRNHKMQSVFKFIDRESCVFSCVYGFKIQNKSRLPTRKYKIKWNANQDAGWDQDMHVLHMNKLVNRQLSIVQLQKKYRHIQRAHRTKGTQYTATIQWISKQANKTGSFVYLSRILIVYILWSYFCVV